MTDNEIRVLKANILGGMDTYIREALGDDDVTEWWNAYGVPDGATEEDLMEYAQLCFKEIAMTFALQIEREED